jgi:hypothetical protein
MTYIASHIMRAPIWESCTEEDLWVDVATHLARNGVETVMVGGSVVSVYTEGLYQSGDIDLVQSGFSLERLKELLEPIGFKSKGRLFAHRGFTGSTLDRFNGVSM